MVIKVDTSFLNCIELPVEMHSLMLVCYWVIVHILFLWVNIDLVLER